MDIMSEVREYNFLKSEYLFLENTIFQNRETLLKFSINEVENQEKYINLKELGVINVSFNEYIYNSVNEYFDNNICSIPSINNWIYEIDSLIVKMDAIQNKIDSFYKELQDTLFI